MTTISDDDSAITLTVDNGDTNCLWPLIDDKKLLASEYRRRKSGNDVKSVHSADVSLEEAKGWLVQRAGKRTTQLKRPKKHENLLEDRVWCLLYAMGYRELNSAHCRVDFTRSDGSTGKKEIGVYAEDQETVLVVECKARKDRGRRSLQKIFKKQYLYSNTCATVLTDASRELRSRKSYGSTPQIISFGLLQTLNELKLMGFKL